MQRELCFFNSCVSFLVPAAILSGTRGKPPPILAARFASPLAFPFEFELTDANLTPEGAPSEGSSQGERWWARGDLVCLCSIVGIRTIFDLVLLCSLSDWGAYGRWR